jgi:hypothetical protein
MEGDATPSSLLVLDVGGVVFKTSTHTAETEEGFFRGLVRSLRTSEGLARKRERENHPLFVDRDPTHFRHVLNYMRGSPSFPEGDTEMEELEREADFYSLQGLVDLVKKEKRRRREVPVERCPRRGVPYWLSKIETKL